MTGSPPFFDIRLKGSYEVNDGLTIDELPFLFRKNCILTKIMMILPALSL